MSPRLNLTVTGFTTMTTNTQGRYGIVGVIYIDTYTPPGRFVQRIVKIGGNA